MTRDDAAPAAPAGAAAPSTAALVAALHAGDAFAARVRAAEIDPDARWAALARIAASGDPPGGPIAVEMLVEDLDESGTVRRFVRRSLLDEHAVDDVVQETLISVAGSITSFAGDSRVTTWVHRLAQRRVVDHLRRLRATEPLPADDLLPSARISSMIATRATVREAVDRLPEHYREPVRLRDLEGVDYAEIARRLGRPVGTVKGQIARGRAMVATSIGDLA
ncbi:RNA polymerase sigma factor [Litorihabitans aurantiacus]|uniref:DNA-directed RNA polymerase sigma-70 factor n=1 Tax=Litorihabitans aurantiacus TaxID=1930061 RepID=A0AA37UUF6_9MICO|nr:RNA polymerase sigma factor [Litorihabitans aurantiacus]GMA31295.1 DNA-directed RNA polymerase sigma-70 factor [Litorihabitans aurantiacus]